MSIIHLNKDIERETFPYSIEQGDKRIKFRAEGGKMHRPSELLIKDQTKIFERAGSPDSNIITM